MTSPIIKNIYYNDNFYTDYKYNPYPKMDYFKIVEKGNLFDYLKKELPKDKISPELQKQLNDMTETPKQNTKPRNYMTNEEYFESLYGKKKEGESLLDFLLRCQSENNINTKTAYV